MARTPSQKAAARSARKTRKLAALNNLCTTCKLPESETGKRDGLTCDSCRDVNRQYLKSRVEKLIRDGLCTACKRPSSPGKKKCEACLIKFNSRSRDAKKNNQCVVCLGPLDVPTQIRCNSCRERGNSQHKAIQDRIRDIVFAAYGGAYCVCCGESQIEFLTLDHKLENGGELRKQRGHRDAYRWCIKNNFPPIFQVMCIGCNWVRTIRSNGVCPHKRKVPEPFTFVA